MSHSTALSSMLPSLQNTTQNSEQEGPSYQSRAVSHALAFAQDTKNMYPL